MPAESLVVVIFVVCAFLAFMAAIAYVQRVASGRPVPVKSTAER